MHAMFLSIPKSIYVDHRHLPGIEKNTQSAVQIHVCVLSEYRYFKNKSQLPI